MFKKKKRKITGVTGDACKNPFSGLRNSKIRVRSEGPVVKRGGGKRRKGDLVHGLKRDVSEKKEKRLSISDHQKKTKILGEGEAGHKDPHFPLRRVQSS